MPSIHFRRGKSRQKPKTRRLILEHLEERSLLAVDLTGWGFSADDFAPAGGYAAYSLSIANLGDQPAYTINYDIYLSHDQFFGSLDDVKVVAGGVGQINGSSVSVPLGGWAALPAQNNAFWTSGDGYYFLGVVIDPYNFVFETNEFNNASTGLFADYDSIYVYSTRALAELSGTSFQVNTTDAAAGGQLDVSFGVYNSTLTSAGPFQVGFYLSTDQSISTSDRLIGSYFSVGLTGVTSLYTAVTLTLPGFGDPIYVDGLPLYVGMVVDPENSVLEGNEFDNSNRGLGIDVAQLTVQSEFLDFDIDPSSLPATGYAPGTWVRAIIAGAKGELNDVTKSVAQLKKAATRIVPVADLGVTTSRLKTALGKLDKAIAPIVSGKRFQAKIGNQLINRNQLELMDRLVAYLVEQAENSQSRQVAAPAIESTFSELSNSDTIPKAAFQGPLVPLVKFLEQKWDEHVVKPASDWVHKKFEEVSKAAKSVGDFITNTLSGAAEAIGLKKKIVPGQKDQYEEAKQKYQEAAQAAKARYDNDLRELESGLGIAPKDSSAEWEYNFDKGFGALDDYYDRIAGNLVYVRLEGPIRGTLETPDPYGGIDQGNMKINFTYKADKSGGSLLTGAVEYTFFRNGQAVKNPATGTFFARFVDATHLQGRMTLKTPGGAQGTVNFTWKVQGLVDNSTQGFISVSGDLYDNSLTAFATRRAQ